MYFLRCLVVASVLLIGECQTILKVEVGESRAFQYSLSSSGIQECYVTVPSGSSYELLPNGAVISSIDSRYSLSSTNTNSTCGLSIESAIFSDSGSYILNIIDSANIRYQSNYILRVQERTSIWPSSSITLVATQSAYLFLPNLEGTVETCYVTPPSGDEITIGYGSSASTSLRQWSPTVDSWCGIEIRDVTESGYWQLTAALNSTHHYYHRALIQTEDSSLLENATSTISSYVGLTLNDTVGRENASYCQLKNPQGEVGDLTSGQCNFNLTTLTSQHNGTWTAVTGLKGTASEVTDFIDVQVETISYIYTGFSQNQVYSGAIDLYCRVHEVESEVCRFVSPNGTGISMTLGVGNDDYAPYYDPEGLHTCGVTIRKVSIADYGTWSCYTGNTSDVRIGYITVPSDDNSETMTRSTTSQTLVVSESYTAFTVYNQSLTLGCSAKTSLSYCWFKHPNGSYYSAVPDATDTDLWSYSGTGFAQGSCQITFTTSTYDDAGTWTCNLGISGQAVDLSVDIQVQVTSSVLTAISVEEVDGTASVECAVLDDTKALSYCRFIRPDGTGINALYADSDSKYSLSGDLTQGSCILTISSIDEADKGNWTCAGKLETYSSELADTFEISSAPKLGFGIILLGVSIFGALTI